MVRSGFDPNKKNSGTYVEFNVIPLLSKILNSLPEVLKNLPLSVACSDSNIGRDK